MEDIKKIYVCSPYRTFALDGSNKKQDSLTNLIRAERISLLIAENGKMPLASHLFYARMLQDGLTEESDWARHKGMAFAFELIRMADELWYFPYQGYISSGMQSEITYAVSLGKSVFNNEVGKMIRV